MIDYIKMFIFYNLLEEIESHNYCLHGFELISFKSSLRYLCFAYLGWILWCRAGSRVFGALVSAFKLCGLLLCIARYAIIKKVENPNFTDFVEIKMANITVATDCLNSIIFARKMCVVSQFIHKFCRRPYFPPCAFSLYLTNMSVNNVIRNSAIFNLNRSVTKLKVQSRNSFRAQMGQVWWRLRWWKIRYD